MPNASTDVLKSNIKGYLEQLSHLVARNNAMDRYDLNKDSENIVRDLLNLFYSYNFINANESKRNYPAVDLVDEGNRLSVQVSSTVDANKITSTCEKFVRHSLYDFFDRLIFYFITSKSVNYYEPTKNKINQTLSNYIVFDLNRDVINNTKLGDAISKDNNRNTLEKIEYFLSEKLALPSGGKFDAVRGYVVPKKLNSYSGYSISELVGRGQCISDIYSKFNTHNLVLLSGISGIGKTTVARAYIEIYKQEYDHIAYVDVTSTLEDALLRRLTTVDKSFEYNNLISKRENLLSLIEKISTIYNTILIIDNCNDEEELRELKPILETLDWKILITSRAKPKSYVNSIVEIEHLSAYDAYTLFTNFYVLKDEQEQPLINEIIKEAFFHTKLIVLLAKYAQNNPLMKLDVLLERVKNKEYDNDELNIDIDINEEERSVYDFILLLFDLDKLDGYQRYYMKMFSVLPSQEIPINHLFELFEREENQRYLINTINKLVAKGWIEKYSDDYYRIHPLVQLVIQKKLSPNVDDCLKLINNISYLIENSANHLSLAVYLPYCEYITEYFVESKRKEVAILLNFMSIIYRNLAQIDKANDANTFALKIFEELGDSALDAVAQSYGYLMSNHGLAGHYEQSLKYGLECLRIQERILPHNHLDLIATYSNISSTCRKLHDYDSSFNYINRAIDALKPMYLSNPDNRVARILTNSYINLSNILADEGRISKNRLLIERSLKSDFRGLIISKKYMDENNPHFSILYNNISLTYRDLELYDKSLLYLSDSIKIKERIFSDSHPELAISYYNMAELLRITKDFKRALFYANKALDIQKVALFPGHRNIAASEALIQRILLGDSNPVITSVNT